MNSNLQERKDKAIARGQKNLFPVYIKKGVNAELWDVEGNRYIDFGAGIAVVNTGHNHVKITKVLHEQIDNFVHTCFMVNPYESAIELAEKLNELVPVNNAKTIFLSTGAEAVENAIKIARAYTKRSCIISFNGSFHGRTNMCLGLTGKVAPYKKGFGPFPNGIYHIPFPIEYYNISVEDSLRALKGLFISTVDPEDVAAIIIELVQGEGGFNIAPIHFVKELRAVCDEFGILLICDEIQTGFARTGTLFATEKYDVEPDLMTLAKGLASGIPIAAVVGKTEIMDAAESLGGTFGGSPLGCAAALKVLEVIEEEKLCEKAFMIGNAIMMKLKELKIKYSNTLGNVRSCGAMVAVEIVENGNPEKPNARLAKQIVKEAQQRGLLLLSCGVYGNAIRILTPLTIPSEILDEGLLILENIINDLC